MRTQNALALMVQADGAAPILTIGQFNKKVYTFQYGTLDIIQHEHN